MSQSSSFRYRIVTDAASDLTKALLQDFPSVEVLPMDVTVGTQSFTYGPNGNLSTHDFYALLAQGQQPVTSQINPARYFDAFSKFLSRGEDILYLGFSSGLSGMYQNACMAAEALSHAYPEHKVICIDTLCAAPGEGFLVLEAARKQRSGATLEDLALWAEGSRLHVCHWFTVDCLTYLHQGGRISAATAVAGTALQIKPLFRIGHNGTLELAGKPRGNRRAVHELLNRMEQQWDPNRSPIVAIAYSGDSVQAEALQAAVTARFPQARCYFAPVGPVIGAHTGPGLSALVYWGTRR